MHCSGYGEQPKHPRGPPTFEERALGPYIKHPRSSPVQPTPVQYSPLLSSPVQSCPTPCMLCGRRLIRRVIANGRPLLGDGGVGPAWLKTTVRKTRPNPIEGKRGCSRDAAGSAPLALCAIWQTSPGGETLLFPKYLAHNYRRQRWHRLYHAPCSGAWQHGAWRLAAGRCTSGSRSEWSHAPPSSESQCKAHGTSRRGLAAGGSSDVDTPSPSSAALKICVDGVSLVDVRMMQISVLGSRRRGCSWVSALCEVARSRCWTLQNRRCLVPH